MTAQDISKKGYEGKAYVPKGTKVTPRIEVIGVMGVQYAGLDHGTDMPRMVDWYLFHGDTATVIKSYEKTIKGWMKVLCVAMRLECGLIVYGVPAAKLQKVEESR